MKIRLAWVSLVMTGLVSAAWSQEPGDAGQPDSREKVAVSVEVEPQQVRLAESFTLTVRASVPDGVSCRLPDALELSPFMEQSRSHSQETVEGRRVQVWKLKLVTYDEVGELTIPGFVLRSEVADGGTAQEVQVPESKIKVLSMLEGVEQPQPRDVAGPVSISVSDYRPLVLLGFVILWAILALCLRFWPARVQAESRLEVLPPTRMAHEIALEKLNQVVQDDLLRKGRFQEFFVRVSDALREYLGNRYGFFALDLTTRELLEELRDRPTPGLAHGTLSRLLEDADMVKFAKLQPSDEMASDSIDGAFEIVQKTKLVEEQVDE